ncbi:MAG: hypothetical protein QOH31_4344 [Verrucomicrobiota bacterium]|jgi:hypothetical protein
MAQKTGKMESEIILFSSLARFLACFSPLIHARAPQKIVMFQGGDGSSLENAIIILGATSESAGVDAEHRYLSRHFPGSAVVQQALLHQAGKVFDRLEIRTATNASTVVYFDITDFFGKF